MDSLKDMSCFRLFYSHTKSNRIRAIIKSQTGCFRPSEKPLRARDRATIHTQPLDVRRLIRP